MKHFLGVVVALLLAFGLTARAAGPEDQYIAIYSLIQQGDAATIAGNNVEATARYSDAFKGLQGLQRVYPTWQTDIVDYRLGYLAKRIAALGKKLPDGAAASVEPPPSGATGAANPEFDRQMAALQAQVRQLQANNDSLQAKLREALSVRPAAADPEQLARAEEHIKALAKENDLLKVSLNDAQSRAAATAGAKQMANLRQQLDEANRKLGSETARANALAREKGDLQDMLNKTTTSPRDSGSEQVARRKLKEAEKKLADQKAVMEQLARDKSALAARLDTLETEARNAIALRAENELLRQQVAALKAAPPASGKDADLSRRLAAAEVQIAALQSERDILRLERAALEGRVKQLTASARPAPAIRADEAARIQQLERQVEDLRQQLDRANRNLAQKKDASSAARADELAAQLAALRARLNVYEAKPAPYSAEELALFRQASPKLAATDPPARKNVTIPKPPPGTFTLVADAQRHFVRGEFDQAEAKYLEVLSKDNKNVYTLANLAAIQLEAGKLDDAEKNLNQALSVAPDDAYCLQTLGYLKFRQEKYDEALTALSQAGQLNPDSAEIQNYLGVTLSHKGQRAAAESALRKALLIEPGYASAHNNLAVIYATQEPPLVDLARWHYQKARAAGHPKNPDLEKMFEQKGAAPNP